MDEILISNDIYHYDDLSLNFAIIALHSAKSLGLVAAPLTIDSPSSTNEQSTPQIKAKLIVGGDVMFRGRAADLLTEALPAGDPKLFVECPYENLKNPERVHIDAYGNVHLYQGLVIGNCWKQSLSSIMDEYSPSSHPICGPLDYGGPLKLASTLQFDISDSFVDECHLCYETRKRNLDKFPNFLTPRQVYGD